MADADFQISDRVSGVSSDPATPLFPEAGDSPVHAVHFYDADEELAATVATYLGDGIDAGEILLVISTAVHRKLFHATLEQRGYNPRLLARSSRLVWLDAQETLEQFMRDGMPCAALFEDSVASRIRLAQNESPGRRLRAYGEMVDLLWSNNEQNAALQLEELWNALQQRIEFALLCGYRVSSFASDLTALHRVCGTHTHISPARAPALQFVPAVIPSSHAHKLTREIAARKEIEAALRTSLRDLRAREADLTRTQAEIQRREEQFRDFIANAPIGLHSVDANGIILWANQAELDLLGYAEHEYVGHSIAEFYADRGVIDNILQRLRDGEELHSHEARLRAKNGALRHVLVSSNALRRDGQLQYTRCFTRDISERKELDDVRTAAAARAHRLLAVTSAIADAVSSEDVFTALVDHVEKAIGASSVALWLKDENAHVARLARCVGYAPQSRDRFAILPLDSFASSPAAESIQCGSAVWIASKADLIVRYPRLAGSVTPSGDYRVAALPLASNGRVLGCLGFTIESHIPPEDGERDLLMLVAKYAGQALERLRLLEQEQRSRASAAAAVRRVSMLSTASRTFAETALDLRSRLNDIVKELSQMLDSCVNISLLDDATGLRVAAVHHPQHEARNVLREIGATALVPLGEGVIGRVAATGESELYSSIAPHKALEMVAEPYRNFLARYPVYSMMAAPLVTRGRVIGVVTTTRAVPDRPYLHEDLRLLEELAERAAAALDNGRLYTESVEGRRRAEQLYRFASSVADAVAIETVYESALASIEAALDADRSAILTFDEDSRMRFRAWHQLSDAYRSAADGHSPWTAAEKSPTAVLVPDALNAPEWSAFRGAFISEGIGALAFIPLVNGGRLLGKFMVYYDGPHVFTSAEVSTANAIANHLASVIVRFEAVQQLQETVRQNELFSAVLAHDLRNPLGAILTASEVCLLANGDDASDVRTTALARIQTSGKRMVTMISQLLDFTKAQTGVGFELECADVDLHEIASQAIGEIELLHPNESIVLDAPPQSLCWGDKARLTQVFSNLVGNAAEHGDKSAPITVRVAGTAAATVSIIVHNSGVIPADVLPGLFDPFRKTRHKAQRSSGLGLGLFIVHQIVRAHGGTVDARSTAEEGTTIQVQLPRRPARAH